MTLKTRGSATLDKAQRRLANLKSIDENLDLGHGLTISAYLQLIEATRAMLESHNTLVSNIGESRRNLTAIEQSLSEMSTRMLSGVATKYSKTSTQYFKAGGSLRKRRLPLTQPKVLPTPDPFPTDPSQITSNHPRNGNGAQPISSY
jgi:hypothetical protein